MAEPISRIREKLAQLAQLDNEFKIFPACDHRYRLEPPLQDAYLEEKERELGITLPSGYRAFLTKLGNGGAGPYYGIYPLETSLTDWRRWWGVADYPYLSRDFPLTKDVRFADECATPPTWEEHVEKLDNDPAYEECWDAVIEKYYDPAWFSGTLTIGEEGDGGFFLLVVRGKGPDTVWARSTDSGIYSLQIDFLGWYERWLDDCLERVRTGNFVPEGKPYSFLKYGNNSLYGSNPWPGDPNVA